MLQKVTFDIAGLFWISLDGNKVCLCINIYFFDTWKVSRLHQQFLTYDDMPAHRRDTSGETAQQNHRKEAHLKANCGRSLTRTTQQRQRRNEGRRKTEVIESGRISSARFSIFWKTFQPLFISFLFDLEQMWVHIFMSTDIIFDYLKLASSIPYLHVQLSWSISALN